MTSAARGPSIRPDREIQRAGMSAIPRRIIQTGKSRDSSVLAKASALNLQLLNPDFEYIFFDDAGVERFIDREFPQHRCTFDAFRTGIQRYDFFRYLAVYRLGGFYFDTDVLLASSLDDLLGCGCVFSFEELGINRFLSKVYGMDWEIGNYAFGAIPGHPFLHAVITNCVRAQSQPEWTHDMLNFIPHPFRNESVVLATTGPGLVSRTLAEYPADLDLVTVLFPEDVRDRSTWHCFGSYGVHLQVGAWKRREGLVRRVLHRTWETRTRRLLMQENSSRGGKRALRFAPATQSGHSCRMTEQDGPPAAPRPNQP
jgi:inositol phosphorylceramide mannosyltransferase catalytic subunit